MWLPVLRFSMLTIASTSPPSHPNTTTSGSKNLRWRLLYFQTEDVISNLYPVLEAEPNSFLQKLLRGKLIIRVVGPTERVLFHFSTQLT